MQNHITNVNKKSKEPELYLEINTEELQMKNFSKVLREFYIFVNKIAKNQKKNNWFFPIFVVVINVKI